MSEKATAFSALAGIVCVGVFLIVMFSGRWIEAVIWLEGIITGFLGGLYVEQCLQGKHQKES